MDRHGLQRAKPLRARIRIGLKPLKVQLWESMMEGVEVETEIGDEKKTDFYPEGIDDSDNRD